MTQVDKQIEWCLSKARKEGEKHKGLKKISPNKTKADEHIAKAKRNLRLVERLIEIKYPDWAVSAIFYSMYHSLLAILWKFGYESKNQRCTFAVIEKLITGGKINISIDELHDIKESSNDQEGTVVEMREYYQYGTDTEVEMDKLRELQKRAKEFVAKVSVMLEE